MFDSDSLQSLFVNSYIDESVEVDPIPHLLPKKELFLERANARDPLNIFAKTSDVCSSGFILLSFCFKTRP